MTYEEARIRFESFGAFCDDRNDACDHNCDKCKEMENHIIEALDKQIPESPLARLIVDDGTEVFGPFCPCCHSVVSRDEFYIQRCRCGKALTQMIWDYTGKSK